MTMKTIKHQAKAIAILAILVATSLVGLAVDKTVAGSDEKTPATPKIKMSAPANGKDTNPIGALVARLGKNHMWNNGIYFAINLPAGAKAQEVLSKAIESKHKDSPLRKKHKVVEVREVNVNGSGHVAVLLDYPDGSRIFLCKYQGAGWWHNFYKAPDKQNRPNKTEVLKPDVSGIVNYTFEPEPEKISPRMYNWELILTEADSRNAAWEIVQVTQPSADTPRSDPAVTKTLIDSKMIVPDQNGKIHFMLHAGNKEPTLNMGAPGNVGHPIIFSGRGTGKGASSWIVLPGSKIQQVFPAKTGTRLVDGTLRIIRFVGFNNAGDRFQSDVILRLTNFHQAEQE